MSPRDPARRIQRRPACCGHGCHGGLDLRPWTRRGSSVHEASPLIHRLRGHPSSGSRSNGAWRDERSYRRHALLPADISSTSVQLGASRSFRGVIGEWSEGSPVTRLLLGPALLSRQYSSKTESDPDRGFAPARCPSLPEAIPGAHDAEVAHKKEHGRRWVSYGPVSQGVSVRRWMSHWLAKRRTKRERRRTERRFRGAVCVIRGYPALRGVGDSAQ